LALESSDKLSKFKNNDVSWGSYLFFVFIR
jgi:hypothetical protein